MKRQPNNTDTFVYHNANPKNKRTTDCVIRAISTATKISYNDVLLGLATLQIKTGYDMSEKTCYGKYLKSLGWEMHKQPRKPDGTKYTGKEFCEALQRGEFSSDNDDRIIAHLGGHHIVAIVYWQVWDTWNSTGGCIGNYWTKA